MKKEDLEEFADELTENEKLIFAYFDDSNVLPDYVERYWDPGALEMLMAMDLIKWTGTSFKLSKEGQVIARHLNRKESGRTD